MNEENKYIEEQEEESSIDFGKIFRDLLKHKKLYYKVLPITFVIAAFIALSIPNYYQCEVKLSPELSSRRSTSSLSSLASSFGINISGAMGNATEALFPTLYPDLMNSVDFKTSLFPVLVTIEGNKDAGESDRTMTYYEYLENEQKSPWWDKAIKSVLGIFSSPKEERKGMGKVDPFRLTPDQYSMVKTIHGKIKWDIGRRIEALTIKVEDQDPLVAATVADSVRERLQEALTEYRTKKARHDLAYIETLYKDAKMKYEKISEVYADFLDANRDVTLETVRLRQTKLENELQLHYSNYNALSAQLLAAKAKVQEKTPVFTTLENATVPLGNAGPFRKRIVMLFVLLVFLCHSAWILHKEDQLKLLLKVEKRNK